MISKNIAFIAIWQIMLLGIILVLYPQSKIINKQNLKKKVVVNCTQLLKKFENPLIAICCAVSSFILLQILCRTLVISSSLSIIAAGIPWWKSNSKSRKNQKLVEEAWPEALDHINSAIHSGVPFSQALANLGERGPEALSPIFQMYKMHLKSRGSLEEALKMLCLSTQDPILKRLTQTILIVRQVGGVQVGTVLRTFTTFLRSDLTAKKEIEMRHGWIKNTAAVAAAAPWILLIFLTFQPQTRMAYNSATGVVVVITGCLVTLGAYLWMNRAARQTDWQRR